MPDTRAITPTDSDNRLSIMQAAGEAANHAAAAHAFQEFQTAKAPNTRAAHLRDLALLAQFLTSIRIPTTAAKLYSSAEPWGGITWGLVKGFKHWLMQGGYAVGSVNRALATVKKYAALASQSGAIDGEQLALIKTVTGYSRHEGLNADETRQASAVPTRKTRTVKGTEKAVKKAQWVEMSPDQAKALKNQPATAQGRRDRLLLCLLLDHGLRVGEIAEIEVSGVNLTDNTLTFYRPKIKETHTHELTKHTRAAMVAWMEEDALPVGKLLRGSLKSATGEKLGAAGLSERAITNRVRALGERVGLAGLSAHDCRHYYATYYAQRVEKLPRGILTLQQGGGWKSLAMVQRYVQAAQIANEGMDIIED